MKIAYDSPDPMNSGEVRAVNRLIDEGKIRDGDRLTPVDLKRLLDCKHKGAQACGSCLGLD